MAACGSCSAENPESARFCAVCGSSLEVREQEEERRPVTAVFVDLVDSTSRAEALDPEEVRGLLDPYFRRVRAELVRFGGTMEKFIGDAVVAFFGVPVAYGDDAERGVRAGLAVLEAIAELNEEDPARELAVRVGVNTGEALVVLDGRWGEGIAWGDVVNTAARLQAAAPAGGVLVGGETYRATRQVVEYREHAPIEAKGKAQPVPVWQAVGTAVEAAAEQPLVGRNDELAAFEALWRQVLVERRSAVALVSGAAGIGKSRLLAEFARRVDGICLRGRCLPYGEGMTYWPLIEALKQAAGILHSDPRAEVSRKLDALVERLELSDRDELRTTTAALSNLLGADTSSPGTSTTEEISQAELHWGLRRVLELLARRRPLVLVLEDLHWAEPTLLELVRFLGESTADAPLLVLCSARTEPGIAAAVELRLELPPLSGDESEAFLRGLIESAPEELLARAEGNPLFLEELAAAVGEGGDAAIPTSLQALIGSRLDALAGADRRAAQHAAVCGTVFWTRAVAHLTGSDTVEESLTELARRDLVYEHEHSTMAGEREWAFKHALIRDVAYGRVPKGRRAQLHLRFADWLGQRPDVADELVEIVAYHLEQSCKLARGVGRTEVPPPVERAVEALTRAAEKAERREGIREADRYYARALELVGEEPSAQALEVRLGRAGTLDMLGELQRADELLVQVAHGATGSGRADLRARAAIGRANIAAKRGQAAEARAHAAEAESIARGSGNRSLEVPAVYIAAYARSWFEDVGDAPVEDLRRGLVLAEELGDKELRSRGHEKLGVLLYNLGDLRGAQEQFERYSVLSSELGSLRDQARVTFQLGLVKYHQGELAEAERLGLQALDWLDRTGDSFWALQNLRALALCAVARSDLGLAEERLRQAIPLALDVGGAVVVETYRRLVEVLIGQDRLDDARELAAFAWRRLPEEDVYARAAGLLIKASLATAEDKALEADEHFAEALALLEQAQLPLDLGEARVAYGRALRRLGEDDRGKTELLHARDDLARMGARGLVDQIEHELASPLA
jgi:class 3 adenylate cyclase/tetratricopeptide (TPR) repeat protein